MSWLKRIFTGRREAASNTSLGSWNFRLNDDASHNANADMSSLRATYREHRAEFSEETVAFLKSLMPIQDSLREFIEAVEEKDWIRTHDDAQELAARFGELKEHLTPHFVAKRAEKEFREVVAKAQSLPFAAVVAGEAAFRHLCSQLESSVQPCQKCGNKMLTT